MVHNIEGENKFDGMNFMNFCYIKRNIYISLLIVFFICICTTHLASCIFIVSGLRLYIQNVFLMQNYIRFVISKMPLEFWRRKTAELPIDRSGLICTDPGYYVVFSGKTLYSPSVSLRQDYRLREP